MILLFFLNVANINLYLKNCRFEPFPVLIGFMQSKTVTKKIIYYVVYGTSITLIVMSVVIFFVSIEGSAVACMWSNFLGLVSPLIRSNPSRLEIFNCCGYGMNLIIYH